MNIDSSNNNSILFCLGEAIILSSVQYAIGSVEMSSKFSVKNFSVSQDVIQNAADALSDYITIGVIWAISNILIMYAKYGWCGAIASAVSNLVILWWMYDSYVKAFKVAADKHKLQMPTVTILGF